MTLDDYNTELARVTKQYKDAHRAAIERLYNDVRQLQQKMQGHNSEAVVVLRKHHLRDTPLGEKS